MSDPNERNDPPRPFMEHLYALRDSVLGMAVSWVLCVIIAGVFSPQINKWIFGPAETCAGISMARLVPEVRPPVPYLGEGELLPRLRDAPEPRRLAGIEGPAQGDVRILRGEVR